MIPGDGHRTTRERAEEWDRGPGYDPRYGGPRVVREYERPSERSIGEMFRELADETRTLVSLELDLAKTELSEKASQTAKDAGFIAAGGFVIYAGFLAIVAAIAFGLANFIPTWLSFLLVGIVVALIGYMLVRKGLEGLKSRSMAPQKTIASLKEDKEWLQRERAN